MEQRALDFDRRRLDRVLGRVGLPIGFNMCKPLVMTTVSGEGDV